MSKVHQAPKDIKCKVPYEVWKKLKVISVMKDTNISELVIEVLGTFVSKKKFEGEENT